MSEKSTEILVNPAFTYWVSDSALRAKPQEGCDALGSGPLLAVVLARDYDELKQHASKRIEGLRAKAGRYEDEVRKNMSLCFRLSLIEEELNHWRRPVQNQELQRALMRSDRIIDNSTKGLTEDEQAIRILARFVRQKALEAVL